MSVRRLGSEDGELLRALAARVKGRAPSEAEAARVLAEHGVFVAFEAEAPVGVVVAYLLPRWDGRTMVCLYELDVDETHRRRGHGRRLVEAVLAWARAAGAAKVWVQTGPDNLAAARTYAAAGARRVGEDVVFTWVLDGG